MIYHKKIELNGWKPAADEIYQYVKNNTHFLRQQAFWNTLSQTKHKHCYNTLAPVFESAGFKLLRISFLIIVEPAVAIHTDTESGIENQSLARVNIPVLNCENTETRFYSSVKWEPIVKKLGNGIKYTYHSPDNCKFESSVSLTEPTILRVKELHNVIVHNPVYPRITLTCALDPDPVYLLEEN